MVNEGNPTVQQQILDIMNESGITYRAVAKVDGRSEQRIWKLLTKSGDPEFHSIRRVLVSIGYDFDVQGVAVEKDRLFQTAETNGIRLRAVSEILEAIGGKLTICKKNQKS